MKFRSFLNLLIVAVLALLSIGAGGFFWLVAQNPLTVLQSGRSSPEAVMFVPRQAPVMVSLLVNPDRLESLRLAAASVGDRRRARAELNQLKQTLLGWTGLTYEQLQPWLDNEMTLAVTAPDFDRNTANGAQPGYLLALASKNPDRAREFLQLFWQKQAIAGVDLVFEQYAGVKIIHGNQAASATARTVPAPLKAQPLATALVGDRFVLLANHPKVLRDAINNVQAPELSLDSTRFYQEALKTLPQQGVGLTFVNLPQVRQWLERDRAARADSAPPLYENLVVAWQLNQRGLIGDTALLTADGQTLPPNSPRSTAPVNALQFIPASSALTAAGTDLGQFWEQFSIGLQGYSQAAALVNQFVSDLQSRWGLSQSDLFDWQGEFALGLIPQDNRAQPDWLFVVEKSAAAAAEIDRLNAIAEQRGFSVGSITLENQTVSAWTKLSATAPASKRSEAVALAAEVAGVHATIGDYEILASSIAAMDQALKAPQSALLNTAEFQQVIAALKPDNDGYLYLDWEPLQNLVEQQLPLTRLVKAAGKPLFDHVRSVAVSSYGTEATVRRGAVFLHLKS
jgi:hypothetical protein